MHVIHYVTIHSDGKKYKVSSSYLVNGGSFYPDQVETHVPASQPLNHSGNNLVSTT